MLIVLTQDQQVINWCKDQKSKAAAWGELVTIGAGGSAAATAKLRNALKTVGADEPLCLTGHGNNKEIGDAGNKGFDWCWTYQEVAGMFASYLPKDYRGPILIEACDQAVNNFATATAGELQKLKALKGVWLYGYNKAVGITHTFPDPGLLGKNVELQPTQVG